MSNVQVPMVLFSGGNDYLADPIDVQELVKTLRQEYVIYRKVIPHWQHLDFIWGMDAHALVYKDIVKIMQGVITASD